MQKSPAEEKTPAGLFMYAYGLFLQGFLEDFGGSLLHYAHDILKQSIVQVTAVHDTAAVLCDEELLGVLIGLVGLVEFVLHQLFNFLCGH